MKSQHTSDRKDSFLDWRLSKAVEFGKFWWPQLNYDFATASTISVVFEEQNYLNLNIPEALTHAKIPGYIINFVDKNSGHYVPPKQLANLLNLQLATHIPDDWNGKTYWAYRLSTRPQNCLTADVDALELTSNFNWVGVEAAQLYDTSSVDNAIRHIFRTFKFRPNQVNPKQYLAQHKYLSSLGGQSFILFHKINQGIVDEVSPVFTIKNDERFYDMLTKIINDYGRFEEDVFIHDFSDYLRRSLVQHKNIEAAYKWLLD